MFLDFSDHLSKRVRSFFGEKFYGVFQRNIFASKVCPKASAYFATNNVRKLSNNETRVVVPAK